MTKDQKVEAYKMVLDGHSFQDIAKTFGTSRHQIYNLFGKGRRRKVNCIYPGLKKWMEENGVTVSLLREICFPEFVLQAVANKLNGNSRLRIEDIKSILSYTGLTFEEAFGEEKKPTQA